MRRLSGIDTLSRSRYVCGVDNMERSMGKRWTDEEFSELKALRESLTYDQIALRMERSVSSLKCAVRRHGNGFSGKRGGRPSGTFESVCRRGLHALTADNLCVRVRNGRTERQCKACMRKRRD